MVCLRIRVFGCDNSVTVVVIPVILKEHSAFFFKGQAVQQGDSFQTAQPFQGTTNPVTLHCIQEDLTAWSFFWISLMHADAE